MMLSAVRAGRNATRSTAQSSPLNVKNAFNTADWNATLAALDGKNVTNYLLELIKDYFKDRVVLYDADDDKKSYAVSVGVT